jgi:hypothetical protein
MPPLPLLLLLPPQMQALAHHVRPSTPLLLLHCVHAHAHLRA